MNRAVLPPNVRGLFARTGAVLDTPGLRLLDAVDAEGNLAASLLLDDAPRRFCSYLIGAHSRTHYTPHAADLLFAHMLRSAREADKEYVHLGLGVNDGIRRFKTKWGGRPALPYVMASWRETPCETGSETISSLVRILLESPSDLSKRQIFDSLPQQRPFAMLWELTKNGRTSWIGGTAHFFCYSFEAAFRNLFERVDTVLFEGPLDADSLDEVARIGKTPDGRHPPLIDLLEEPEIRLLERAVQGPTGKLARFFNAANPNPADVRGLLATTRHWYAFFSLWTAYLERQGWNQSVDLCAWHTALEMGKSVIGMESLEEQVASLESVPLGRVTAFFRGCRSWKGYAGATSIRTSTGILRGCSARAPNSPRARNRSSTAGTSVSASVCAPSSKKAARRFSWGRPTCCNCGICSQRTASRSGRRTPRGGTGSAPRSGAGMAVSPGKSGVRPRAPKAIPPRTPSKWGNAIFPPFGESEPSEWVKGLKKGSRRPQSLKKIGVVNEIGSLRRGDSHKKFFVPAECDNAGGPCLFPHQPFP